MSTATLEEVITAGKVPVSQRSGFLPKMFGGAYLLGERTVYARMERLCADYHGGFWNFYTLSNGGFYMAPEKPADEKMRLVVCGNYFDGEMSADAAGLVASLFALGDLAGYFFTKGGSPELVDLLSDHYSFLREFCYGHPEASLIFRAID